MDDDAWRNPMPMTKDPLMKIFCKNKFYPLVTILANLVCGNYGTVSNIHKPHNFVYCVLRIASVFFQTICNTQYTISKNKPLY